MNAGSSTIDNENDGEMTDDANEEKKTKISRVPQKERGRGFLSPVAPNLSIPLNRGGAFLQVHALHDGVLAEPLLD